MANDESSPAPRTGLHQQSCNPSQEEIKRLCGEIQQGWSAAERRRRSGYTAERVEVPTVRLDDEC